MAHLASRRGRNCDRYRRGVADFIGWLRLQPKYRLTPVIALTDGGQCPVSGVLECAGQGVVAVPHSALPIHVVTQVRAALAQP